MLLALFAVGVPLALIATVVIGIAVRRRRLSAERERGLAGLAAEYGFHLVASDDSLARRWSGDPFGGDGRQADNVLSGQYRGRQVVAFDYKYTVYKQGTFRFGVVVIRLPAALPWLSVSEPAIDLLGAPPIELESERFNEEYQVRAADARYGHAVIHPRMMELLLNRGEVPWRIEGADLIGWVEGPLEAGYVMPRIAALSDIADLIPAFVLSDYGRDPRLG